MLPPKSHFKYSHIFWANEVKFNLPLLTMIEDSFDIREHCFITNNAELFEKIKRHQNVFFVDKKNLFNAIGDYCDWIISHDFPSFKISLTTKIKFKKKIVFRYWGGRRTFPETNSVIRAFLQFFSKALYKIFFKIKYSYIPVVGIANIVDRIDLEGLILGKKLFPLIYATKNQKVVECDNLLQKKDELNVVIGHRSDPIEQHIKYLKLLRKMPRNKVHIFIPLSYGDVKYASIVRDYVENNHLENVTLLTKMVSFNEYCSFLLNMDIAIIDCLNSLALGNIALLVSMGKTIYLNSKGVIAKAFDVEKVPYFDVKDLEDTSFSKFQTLKIMKNVSRELRNRTYEESVNSWAILFNYLKKEK